MHDSDDLILARMLLRNYLELNASQGEPADALQRTLLTESAALFPRAFWLDLAKQVRIQGLSTAEELNACQAQRLCAENDPAHPLSQLWRPASEAHFQAIVRRMAEGLPWAPLPLLEQALTAACGFIDKRGLEQAYRPAVFRDPAEHRRDVERRAAAWCQFLTRTPTRAEHFDYWLACETVREDYVVGSKPSGMVPGPQPPQFYLSLALRYPDGTLPVTDRQYGPAAFSEDIPRSVAACHQVLKLDAPSRLRLKGVPWPEWNLRVDAMVHELARHCGCDSADAWAALDRVMDDHPKGYEAMSEMLEELDVWLALTETGPTERYLEEEERCSMLVETLQLREPADGLGGVFYSAASHVKTVRIRLLRHGLRHPSANLLGPVDARWLHSEARQLAKLLGDERAAAVYLQSRCASPLAETLQRIEAMRPYWSAEPGRSNDNREGVAWDAALQDLPTDQGSRLAGNPQKTTTNEFITATRKEWVQCFNLLPPTWLDLDETGPAAGQLLAALPDEAILEADVDGSSGFSYFSSAKLPLAAVPAVVACSSTGRPSLSRLRAAKNACPPIGSGWVEVYWD